MFALMYKDCDINIIRYSWRPVVTCLCIVLCHREKSYPSLFYITSSSNNQICLFVLSTFFYFVFRFNKKMFNAIIILIYSLWVISTIGFRFLAFENRDVLSLSCTTDVSFQGFGGLKDIQYIFLYLSFCNCKSVCYTKSPRVTCQWAVVVRSIQKLFIVKKYI